MTDNQSPTDALAALDARRERWAIDSHGAGVDELLALVREYRELVATLVEERDNWHAIVKAMSDDFECIPECVALPRYAQGHHPDCPVTNGHAAFLQVKKERDQLRTDHARLDAENRRLRDVEARGYEANEAAAHEIATLRAETAGLRTRLNDAIGKWTRLGHGDNRILQDVVAALAPFASESSD